MTQLSINKFGDNLPVTGIVAFSQATIGFGLGLLVGDAMGRSARQKLALAVIASGVAALIPLAAGIVVAVKNRPTSPRRMRKQLESIRRDTGLSEDDRQF